MNDSGYIGVTNSPKNDLIGLATFSKSAAFHIDEHSAMSLKEIVEKEVNLSPLEPSDKEAFLSILDTSGSILFTHLSSACSQKLTVTNVAFPETDVSTHTLYVSCLAREAFSAMKGLQQPHVLCGRFNIPANGPAYQLLKDGYLSNEMIEDLQARKDVSLPGKENAALVNLLWKAFQHPSSHLRSCYSTVKGCELVIPETEPGKTKTSPNLVWFSSDSLNTVGVLDIESSLLSCGFESLKADIAFVSSCT
ncbi:uncharacterized protein LOC143251193 [Tachypleus tridentatus]|uniref:uncharacterized protein LOC143251193 n=1 Tax=Tachypleus tridentatus TaxID=6853 RepID=UPI003FD06A94